MDPIASNSASRKQHQAHSLGTLSLDASAAGTALAQETSATAPNDAASLQCPLSERLTGSPPRVYWSSAGLDGHLQEARC